MKLKTTLIALLFTSKSFSQNAGDSLIVKFDTSVFKNVIAYYDVVYCRASNRNVCQSATCSHVYKCIAIDNKII